MDIKNWIRRTLPAASPATGSLAPWQLRDSLAALTLFAATAAVVLWQNAHVAVLWDLSYVLDTATRIAQSQIPYRDFPLPHPPLTFLLQAAIIRLTSRVYFHHALYCAIAGGLGSLLAWRITLRTLAGRIHGAWPLAFGLTAPVAALGLYCIFPFPSYDCDTLLTVLFALWLLQRLTPTSSLLTAALTGAALVPPLFGKQNIGLPLLAVVVLLVVALLVACRWMPARVQASPRVLLALLAGAAAALAVAVALLAATAGLGNYLHWTIVFASQRRLPGLSQMLEVYACPFLCWALPSVLTGLLLLRSPHARRNWAQTRTVQAMALALLAAPWLFTLASLFLYEDADSRGDALVALWPLVLVLAALLVAVRLLAALRGSRSIGFSLVTLVAALAAIHGTLMSQQLWGSTYALWPLFLYLCAELLATLAEDGPEPALSGWIAPTLAGLVALTLAVCGSFYTASEERLSYANLDGGPPNTSEQPSLSGLATPGAYLANFDELVAFANAAIPQNDVVLLLPGEDPFYFATGRKVAFPVLLFDPATDPYSPEQTLEQVHQQHVHWLIVKHELQIKENPMPDHDATLHLLQREFFPVAQLRGYDVYHFVGAHPHQPAHPQ